MAEHADLSFTLIHGAGLGVWVWDDVILNLDWPALAASRAPQGADLRRMTLARCARWVKSRIEAARLKRVILVAHSIGGVIAPAAAALLPDRAAHIVFVGATIPPEGRSALDTFAWPDRLMMAFGLRLLDFGIDLPGVLVEAQLRRTICNDMDEDSVRRVLQGAKHPEPPALFFERVSRAGMPPIPCTYVKLLQDKGSLPPAKQDEMAANIGARAVTLDTGHTAMVSRPRELAALLNQVAQGVVAAQD